MTMSASNLENLSLVALWLFQAMCRDSRIVPGAAATEIELAKKLKEFSFKEMGYCFCCLFFADDRLLLTAGQLLLLTQVVIFRLDQYAIAKFAESFEMVPKTLAENAGLNAMEIISSLYAEHASGNAKVGLNLEKGVCEDISGLSIWDLYVTK